MGTRLSRVFHNLLATLFRISLSLRYRIRLRDFEKITGPARELKSGILFLPNHPSELDPLMLSVVLWKQFHPRPLVIEHFYYKKWLRYFMDQVGGLPLPTMDVGNEWKKKQVEKLKFKVLDLLKKRENFLIYPSGRLKEKGEELLGGASFIHDLLQEDPNLNIVLIRTTGLWGSLFSRALTGTSPDFMTMMVRGFKILFKNGIFFTPRRDVLIEFDWANPDFPRRSDRLGLNRYLEDWYNRYPEKSEPLKLVSFAFWKEDLPAIEIKEERVKEGSGQAIPQEVREQTLQHLAEISRMPKERIQETLHLSNDLGLDSLDIAQLSVYLETTFHVRSAAPGEMQTVRDLMEAASGFRRAKTEKEEEPPVKRSKWPFEAARPVPRAPEGETIQEAFLKVAARFNNFVACADDIAGFLSYSKLKRATTVLALTFRSLPGDKVGVMLPASSATFLVIFALLMARKVPVMLNWTAGSKSLEHSVHLTELKVVISSYRFLSRIENGDFKTLDELFLLLEEMRYLLPLKQKIKGLFLSLFPTPMLMRYFKLNKVSKNETAVILFTSGTETLPKAVPLSHDNLLSNHRAAFPHIPLTDKELLYSILPPFHSFGFSVTGLLPLLTGIKVYFSPDPTNSRKMADDVAHWKPTLFCSAPSFMRSLFHIAKRGQLDSLRLIVSGAEKATEDLFDYVANLKNGAEMIEGYGITECSPIVTIQHQGAQEHQGVGYPLDKVELRIVNPDSLELEQTGKEGEVLIAGPNVFSGYLGEANRNPFIELEGRRWYRSGDRGRITVDGELVLTGRLKRFVKIGGEMVSLSGIEEELLAICREKRWDQEVEPGSPPSLAVVASGRESEKPEIILFTTLSLDREAVNSALKDRGMGRLVKIARIEQLKQIPLTSTGKTHYRLLDEKAAALS